MTDIYQLMPKRTNEEKALIALLECNSIRDAAKVCKLSEETLYRYLRNVNFIDRYREARRRTLEIAISRMQNATGDAVETLLKNLHCENPAVEVRTAQIILENAMKGLELIGVLDKQEDLMRQNVDYHYERLIEGYKELANRNPHMTHEEKVEGIRTFARISGLDEKELARRSGIELTTDQ